MIKHPLRLNFRHILFVVFFFSFNSFFSQVSSSSSSQEIALDPVKVNMFEKYCVWKHSFEPGGFAAWKAANPDLYQKEMWYYTESFYIKRNHLSIGDTMDESMIDVSRFETQRSADQEVIVTFGGFKDVMVLIPGNQLIHKVK